MTPQHLMTIQIIAFYKLNNKNMNKIQHVKVAELLGSIEDSTSALIKCVRNLIDDEAIDNHVKNAVINNIEEVLSSIRALGIAPSSLRMEDEVACILTKSAYETVSIVLKNKDCNSKK
jgi:hypothetical protein